MALCVRSMRSYLVVVEVMKEEKINICKYYFIPVVVTLVYWLWESRAEGNIRVDLVFIYPILLVTYIVSLWRVHKFMSVIISVLIMLLNIGFFMVSYDLFDKYAG